MRLKEEKVVFSSEEPVFKPTTILTIEQQRERERQRIREEEERRKKVAARKDHQPAASNPPMPKFEPLTVDMNNEEPRPNKSKTPTTGTGTFSPHFPLTSGTNNKFVPKPSSITPQPPRPTNQDENDPNTGEPSAAIPTPVPKKFTIKKRSSTLVRSMNLWKKKYFFLLFSILPHLWSLINMNSARRWAMEISRLFIVRNYVVANVNMPSKSSINPR